MREKRKISYEQALALEKGQHANRARQRREAAMQTAMQDATPDNYWAKMADQAEAAATKYPDSAAYFTKLARKYRRLAG